MVKMEIKTITELAADVTRVEQLNGMGILAEYREHIERLLYYQITHEFITMLQSIQLEERKDYTLMEIRHKNKVVGHSDDGNSIFEFSVSAKVGKRE